VNNHYVGINTSCRQLFQDINILPMAFMYIIYKNKYRKAGTKYRRSVMPTAGSPSLVLWNQRFKKTIGNIGIKLSNKLPC
jgi:hypothetical protein